MSNLTPRHFLIAQLRKDRNQFAFYATNHRAKTGDPTLSTAAQNDAATKAVANETMVSEIDALLHDEPKHAVFETVGSSDNVDQDRPSDPMAQAKRDAESERRVELIGTLRQAHDEILKLQKAVDRLTPKAHAYDTIAQIARISQHEQPQGYGIDVRWRMKGAIETLIAERDAS
jgi:hypothetical protein